MKDILIIGNSSYSIMLYKYICMTTDWNVIGFSAEKEYITKELLCDLKVYEIEKLDKYDELKNCKAVLGIGYKKMGILRERLYMEVLKKGISFVNYIHPTAVIAEDAVIGNANNIFENVVIEEGCVLGNANLLYAGCIIGHESKVGNFNTFSIGAITLGCVKVKNNCFFGGRSVVRDNVNIGDCVLVGAGAYADREIKENSVFVPARGIVLEDKTGFDFI